MARRRTPEELAELRDFCRWEVGNIEQILASGGPMTQQHRLSIVSKCCNIVRELNGTVIDMKHEEERLARD